MRKREFCTRASRRRSAGWRHAWAAIGLALFAAPVGAIDVSPDITLSLGGVTVQDEDVAEDLGGVIGLLPLGSLPANADIVGYEDLGGEFLLAFDTTVSLSPGGVTAERRDVVRWDGSTYSLEFDGSAESIPDGVAIDAVGVGAASELLLSFDTTVALPVAGTVDDEEVVAFSGGSYSVFYDGSGLGSAALTLDTDAVQLMPNGDIRLSFDRSGLVSSIFFDDEDALDYTPGSGTWSLAYDGTGSDANWGAGDLVALPEPGLSSVLLGAALVAALARRRDDGDAS
ncbi:MAG: hypothetical protein AAF430_09750 [Myxococcota bacterium]